MYNKNVVNFINKLKKPEDIKIKDIRKYNNNTPSVTGLLSLIDAYIPKDIEAFKRWISIHKYIENMLIWKRMNPWLEYLEYILNVLPYIRWLKAWIDESLYLETKLKIPWVFWWTIDYIKINKNGSMNLIDFKTSSKMYISYKSDILLKYNIQLYLYSILINKEFKKKKYLYEIKKELFFITPKGCIKQWIYKSNTYLAIYSNILILYFHIINMNKNNMNKNNMKLWSHFNRDVLKWLISYIDDENINKNIRIFLLKWITLIRNFISH